MGADAENNQSAGQIEINKSDALLTPSYRKCESSSDCTSLYSHEEVNLVDNPFNPRQSDVLQPRETTLLSACTSVPHLDRRRSSIPARILINPTSHRSSIPAKSLNQLNICQTGTLESRKSKRRRRETTPAKITSSHSVFDCEQGCFDVEEITKSQQFVFITTGPMVI